MKIKTVTTDDRKLELNWDLINRYLSRWKPGTPIDVEIVRRQKKRSDPLRRWYFGAVLPPFMDYLGYERDEELLFHLLLKIKYFKHTHNIHQDKHGMWRNVPSVFSNESDMPVSEKQQFVEWVIRKAAEQGCYIESPE